jgi:hypothetical protein
MTSIKVPKTLGACADRLFTLKAQLAALNMQAEALDAERKAIQERLIADLPKSEAAGIAGRLARATVVTKEVPTVKDWTAFYKTILKTKDFSLLQRRVSDAAVRERWEAGKKVPGVEPFTVVTVSVTKL